MTSRNTNSANELNTQTNAPALQKGAGVRVRSTVFPLLAAFIWGIAFVAQKYNTVGPLTFNASRAVVAFVFLLLVVLVMQRGSAKHLLTGETPEETRALWRGGAALGFMLALATMLQQMGLDAGAEAGKAGFLTALYIVLVPLLGIFLKKRITVRVWIAVAMAVVGLYLLCVKGGFDLRPCDILVIACALGFAVHILLIDHYSPLCHGVKLSCIQFLFAAIFSGLGALLTEDFSLPAFSESLMPILYLGVMSSGVAYTLQIVAQKDANPAVLSLLLSMESVFSVLAGAVLLGEVLLPREYVGCAVMLVAVILAQLPARERGEQE